MHFPFAPAVAHGAKHNVQGNCDQSTPETSAIDNIRLSQGGGDFLPKKIKSVDRKNNLASDNIFNIFSCNPDAPRESTARKKSLVEFKEEVINFRKSLIKESKENQLEQRVAELEASLSALQAKLKESQDLLEAEKQGSEAARRDFN